MDSTDGDAMDPLPPASPGPEPVDAEKVAALRAAFEAGRLRLDPQLVAVRLLGWERLLTRT
jgi:anti-sigma28 factor (negative regulator of flagellin synthesis)